MLKDYIANKYNSAKVFIDLNIFDAIAKESNSVSLLYLPPINNLFFSNSNSSFYLNFMPFIVIYQINNLGIIDKF